MFNEPIWLEHIVDKIERKHSVRTYEVDEVFASRPRINFIERGNRAGEDMYAAYGRTETGRYLVVFYIARTDSRLLIVSARDMSGAERRRYERR